MAFDFPNSPSLGQQVTSTGGKVYTWDGTKWASTSTVIAAPGGVIVAPTPPTTVPNAMWWDSVGGQLYVYYDDGNTVQWVPATSSTPLNAASKADVATALNDVGRNLVHNPLFNIAQRGVGPWTASAITLDRWAHTIVSDTVQISQTVLADAARTAIGDEQAAFAYMNVFTGNAAAAAQNYTEQRIENVRRLAGKTVTLSFYAAALAGTPKIGINFVQVFGTGGSPSAGLFVNATGQSVQSTATWTRFSVTTTFPSVAGKTLGTNNNDYSSVLLYFSSGATNNATAGNIGVQSGTVQLWGVQLEVSPVATPLEKPDPQQDLAKCQRFYQTGNFLSWGYTGASTVAVSIPLPVPLRAMPSAITVGTPAANVNLTSPGITPMSNQALQFIATGTAAANYQYTNTWTVTADL